MFTQSTRPHDHQSLQTPAAAASKCIDKLKQVIRYKNVELEKKQVSKVPQKRGAPPCAPRICCTKNWAGRPHQSICLNFLLMRFTPTT
jgi:hypothetical protein